MSPVDHQVWEIDECFLCWGENKECQHCKGTNRISVNRCPYSMVKHISRTLQHFARYMKFGVYPNGSSSMLKQPIGLINSISIYEHFINKYEAEIYRT